MSSAQFFVERPMHVYEQQELRAIDDPLVLEVPLTIRLNDAELVTLACSPEAYLELAVGYLLSEGIMSKDTIIKKIALDNQTVIIEAHPIALADTANAKRFINTCIGRGFQINRTNHKKIPLTDEQHFKAELLLNLIRELDEKSVTFRRTGGVHSAALGCHSGLLVRYEDIGRHNAVDKVFGHAFLNGIPLEDKCLVLSGRVASEILIKALRNGVPLVLSRSAPTLMAVELAEQFGVTIVGFARGHRFNVYSHSSRISI